MLPAIRLFLPKLRPVALVPDGPSANLAHNAGVASLLRFPAPAKEFGPLLSAIRCEADLAIMDASAESNLSALAETIHFLFGSLTARGELVLVIPSEIEKSLFGNLLIPGYRRGTFTACAKLAAHVWLRVADQGKSALFIARGHTADEPARLDLAHATEAILEDKARRRPVWRNGMAVYDHCDRCTQTEPRFAAALTEYRRATGGNVSEPHPHNLWTQNGALRVWLDAYQLFHPEIDDTALRKLNGYTVGALFTGSSATTLRDALDNALLRIAPDVRAQAEQAAKADAAARAPFYALPPLQRLGWLIEHEWIFCADDLGPFKKGKRYQLECVTTEFTKVTTRQNLFGDEEDVSHHAKDYVFEIRAANGTVHKFADWTGRRLKNHTSLGYTTLADKETRHSLTTLCEHFEIPEVPDVATLCPKRYDSALAILDDIEREAKNGLRWRAFQRDDLARFSLHPGGVFAWDKGGGKGLALYAIPRVYRARRVLIVAPEGLHDQICTEWREKFGFAPRPVMTAADIERDPELKAAMIEPRAEWKPLEPGERPSFWLTSYTALGFNGADEWPDEVDEDSGERLVSKRLLKARESEGFLPRYAEGIGTERVYRDSELSGLHSPVSGLHKIRCVWKPSLAALLSETFDCVECDEAVRLKATDSFISLGVRRMRPRFPVALTGTPVKNRLEDLFWLAHWTCGSPAEGNSRFPFQDNSSARERFADLFMVIEENHTRAEKYAATHGGRRKKFLRRLPQCTNLHALWRVLGSIVMRRRKEDFGEDIASKTIIPVRVKPGRAQQEVYRFHLAHPPTHNAEGKPMDESAALLAQLGNLRQAALSPDSPNLKRGDWPNSASWTDHTPLFAGACELIVQCLSEGEQVMLASPFTHWNASFEARLREAGVSCVRLDGETQATERGRLAREFKRRAFSVLIAGQQAMGEGHSFDQCATLILPSLHWAYDVNSQVEDRVHRLTSRKPVSIYVLSVTNTIAEQLLALYREKSAASAAAVDGRLFAGPDEEEVSLGQLLRNAREQFNADAQTIDETAIEAEWPALRERLRAAEAAFRAVHPVQAESMKDEVRRMKGRNAAKRRTPAPAPTAEPSTFNLQPSTLEKKLPPPRGKLATAIRNLPTHTLAVLHGTTDTARLARVRAQFEAFAMTTDHSDYRRAWADFNRLPLSHRERLSIAKLNPETETNPMEDLLEALV